MESMKCLNIFCSGNVAIFGYIANPMCVIGDIYQQAEITQGQFCENATDCCSTSRRC